MKNVWIDFIVAISVLYCVFTDVRYQKIRNYITFPLMLFGIIINSYCHGLEGLLFSLKGLLTCAIISIPLAIVEGFGFGDVKLLMGIGAVKGSIFALDVTSFSFFVTVILAIIRNPQKFVKALRNLLNAFVFFMVNKKVFGISKEQSALTMSYAVCIFLGLIMAYISGGDWLWTLLTTH